MLSTPPRRIPFSSAVHLCYKKTTLNYYIMNFINTKICGNLSSFLFCTFIIPCILPRSWKSIYSDPLYKKCLDFYPKKIFKHPVLQWLPPSLLAHLFKEFHPQLTHLSLHTNLCLLHTGWSLIMTVPCKDNQLPCLPLSLCLNCLVNPSHVEPTHSSSSCLDEQLEKS